jgi:hypothetical protein
VLLDAVAVVSERLSAFDAFFLAFQRRAGVAMHLGLSFELHGTLTRSALDAGIDSVLARWPDLARVVRAGLLGVRYAGPSLRDRVLDVATSDEAFDGRMNDTIDPFTGPSLSVTWREANGAHRVLVRAHHASFDGEGFVAMALRLIETIASHGHEHEQREGGTTVQRTSGRRGARGIVSLWREKREKDRRVIADAHRRIALACARPGPVAVECDRIEGDILERVRAQGAGGGMGLRAIAAWTRAVHADIGDGGEVAVEVPVSLRAATAAGDAMGNHLAPLVFYADGTRPLADVTRALRQQFRSAITRGHLDVDRRFAAPGRWLPWPVFERVAITPITTGNATSHVAALRLDRSPRERVRALSHGALELARWTPFSPVCLRMGAALTVIDAPDELVLAVTYRANALSRARARAMLDRAREELCA